MPIYAETTADQATHTVEVFRGTSPAAEGVDIAEFVGANVQLADAVYAWLEQNGVTPDDPDTYALVVPTGEGQDNPAITMLPIAPVDDGQPELVAEQTAARGGRPRLADGEPSAQISFRVPWSIKTRLDKLAGSNRSALLQQWTMAGLADLEVRHARTERLRPAAEEFAEQILSANRKHEPTHPISYRLADAGPNGQMVKVVNLIVRDAGQVADALIAAVHDACDAHAERSACTPEQQQLQVEVTAYMWARWLTGDVRREDPPGAPRPGARIFADGPARSNPFRDTPRDGHLAAAEQVGMQIATWIYAAAHRHA